MDRWVEELVVVVVVVMMRKRRTIALRVLQGVLLLRLREEESVMDAASVPVPFSLLLSLDVAVGMQLALLVAIFRNGITRTRTRTVV